MTRPSLCAHFVPGLFAFVACSLFAPAAHAISSQTLFTPTGVANDNMGFSVSNAGDVNGDGYADVIVGAHLNDAAGADAGRAYVYFGGPNADATPDWTLTGVAANDNFGVSVSTAGDVNGDGYADVIVGARNAGGTGRAYVYFGGTTPDATADLTRNGAAAGDLFGYSVSDAGDLNGDGYGDVIVGAYLNDAVGVDAGQAYLYFGGSAPNAVADLTFAGAAAGDRFGVSVSDAGDVNGDGFADVIVGASLNDFAGADAGRAYVFYGGGTPNSGADLFLSGAAAGDSFGTSVSSAGDVNRDGFGDVIVGASGNDAGGTDAGRAYVYFGTPLGDQIADWTLTGLVAGDQFGVSVSAGDMNGDGYGDVIVGAFMNDVGAVNAGRAYVYLGGESLDPIADVALTGVGIADAFGIAVSTAGDVDGDGFADVIVGGYLNDAGGSNAGRAYVISIYPYRVVSPNGGELWVAGRPATVRWRGHDRADLWLSLDAGLNWSLLRTSVGGAEDNQITIIAPPAATAFAQVRVSSSEFSVTHSTSDASDGVFRIDPPTDSRAVAVRPSMTAAGTNDGFGSHVSSAGDVNGDGFSDVIVGAPVNNAGGTNAGRAYVFYGGPGADAVADWTLTGAAFDGAGSSVSAAGDVNGDGYADVIVGASATGGNTGRAYVYYGGPAADAIADLVLNGAAAGDYFGLSVSSAGDVNGDGFSDVIVGALGNAAGGPQAGRAYVYYGGTGADAVADLTLTGTVVDFFGNSVSAAGDVNGDGFADVIVGAPQPNSNGPGRACVYFGGPGADVSADLTLTGESSFDRFGQSVSTAGDVNGDGYSDVIVGAYGNEAGGVNAGRAYVYFGGPGLDAIADLTLTGAAASDAFGYSVSTAGDVNRDGFADVIVGAYGSAAGTSAGRAYVYFGGPGADAVADVTLTGAVPSESFGISVATAGDMNGDGFADVIIGGQANPGRFRTYDFNRYFVVTPNDDELWNVGASQSVSWLGAEPADLWLSTDGGASYALQTSAVGGQATNTLNLLVPHTPTKFARVKLTPHDSALSGFDASDSLFTIQSSVALLNLVATLGDGGAELAWSSDPAVGPGGIAGYRVYRIAQGANGEGARIGPDLITETHYLDPAGTPGTTYRLIAVNGLMEELELGRVSLAGAAKGLVAWPSPLGRGGVLNLSLPVPYAAPGFPATDLDVAMFDLAGRRVATLAQGPRAGEAGAITLRWDTRGVAAGVYFVRARAATAGWSAERKVLVLP